MEELILKEQETREELVQVINKSNLPAFMLEPMLKDIYQQIEQEKVRQYQEAVEAKQKKEQKKKEAKNGQD